MVPIDSSPSPAALERVRRLIVAARDVASDPAMVAPLADSTGLSREGVTLALARSLEVDASEAELHTLIGKAIPATHVHVILSANVFTASLRALAVAWASSEKVTVRPSRRDPLFTRALVHAVNHVGLGLAETADVSSVLEGEIHVYGRDETVSSVTRAARPGVIVRRHGAGMGIALVTRGAERGEAARAIADDVVVFDQRGCLSPRIVFVLGEASVANEFAEVLSAHLFTLERTVPRGRLDEDERRQAVRYIQTMTFAGRMLEGSAHAVGVAESGSAPMIPPVGRHVHVVAVEGVLDARSWLAPIARFVVAVGCDDENMARGLLANEERVRWSKLGWMQRPPLDGAVDLR